MNSIRIVYLHEEKWRDKRKPRSEQELDRNIYNAQCNLKEYFDVDNLSLIERYWLKKIIKQTLDDRERYKNDIHEGRIQDERSPGLAPVRVEASARWFLQLYGLTRNTIEDIVYVMPFGESDPKYRWTFLSGQYDEAETKYNQLCEEQPDEIFKIGFDTSPQMKDYIQIVRDQAHLL